MDLCGTITTYQNTGGGRVNLTSQQVKACEAAGVWPSDQNGEMCQVYHGAHYGPFTSHERVAALCGVDLDTFLAHLPE